MLTIPVLKQCNQFPKKVFYKFILTQTIIMNAHNSKCNNCVRKKNKTKTIERLVCYTAVFSVVTQRSSRVA